ncbi:hypothetical protein K7X08_026248 [Anisodus acutangulus]|uniref:Uncharacterized protein n=1 Tax=Anisodus acutangulus TaxID=402998 RepID=A0A9Q1N2K9_9SOLA|nr:hypothetical protein K7X08_026248 [Anisodus acutangulus]
MAAVNKFAIFFVVLLTMTIVDMPGTSKLQVMGACGELCQDHPDACGGWSICRFCKRQTNPNGQTYIACAFLP